MIAARIFPGRSLGGFQDYIQGYIQDRIQRHIQRHIQAKSLSIVFAILFSATCFSAPTYAQSTATGVLPAQNTPTANSVIVPGRPENGGPENVSPLNAAVVSESAADGVGLWQRLWQSPRQIANKLLQQKNYSELAKETGEALWGATGQYREGDYQSAANSFSQSTTESSRYNHASSLAQLGEYDKALELLDQVLEHNPQHEDAKHNRGIVEQLKELAEQQQQQSDEESQGEESEGEEPENSESQDGDSGDSSEQQSEESDQQSGEQQSEESDQQNGGSEAETAESSEQEGESKEEQMTEQERQAEQEQQAAEREALEQAREKAAEELRQQAITEEPLSESEQATEQWLRQIPDDPAGLLRRKLQRDHASEYPSLRDSREPW